MVLHMRNNNFIALFYILHDHNLHATVLIEVVVPRVKIISCVDFALMNLRTFSRAPSYESVARFPKV